MNEISEIIQSAYAVFHKYPLKFSPSTMHWTSEDPEIRGIQRHVKATALNCLDPETLREVIWNATTDERSFKHFLPRVLECISTGSWSLSDVGARLQPEAIRLWPEDEAHVVRDFLAAHNGVANGTPYP